MAPAVVGYFNLRGLAQPIRNLLAYVGEDFEDKFYDIPGDTFEAYKKSSWWEEKFTLGLDFPNVPYYVDGKLKITQSSAILRYIARKHGMEPTTEQDKIRLDVAEGSVVDLRNGYIKLIYDPNFAAALPTYISELPGKWKLWSEFLGDRKWILGDKISQVDFILYEMLYQHNVLSEDTLKEFSNLNEFIERFEALDKIAKHMKSDKFVDHPFNGPWAGFGGK